MMKIQLTRGFEAAIDDSDAPKIFAVATNWCAVSPEGKTYAVARPHRHGPLYLMHRVIMDAPPGSEVDHKNGDGLDNRRQNLRLCTTGQNAANRRTLRSDNTSGFKGVSRSNNRWRADITLEGKRITIGHFATAKEAAAAYDQRASELFGEFAATNSEVRGSNA